MALRRRAAVLTGKLTRVATRRLGHGGTALPGVLAERVDPGLVSHLAGQLQDSVLITGTNGKTTTARLLADIFSSRRWPVVHNRAGSNLMRGLAAALIEAADARGRLPDHAVGVFEVDEATLPAAAAAVRPRVLVIGNLFRDQLDRYGEVDSIRADWVRTLQALPASTAVALNADDPAVATLAAEVPGASLHFGIDDRTPGAVDHAAEARWCAACGTDYVYDCAFYAHVGHWRCPGCESRRPDPVLRATALALDVAAADGRDGIAFELATADTAVPVQLPLLGLYNVYNALAATTAAWALGVELDAAAAALRRTAAVFGRQERLQIQGHAVRIVLGKNPAGLNQALRTLQRPGSRHHLLVLLNDDLADGTDVSWIWDTDWEALTPFVQSLVVGGTRAADMALRLQYAGFPPARPPLHNPIAAALRQALDALPAGDDLVVLPTYTAMLAVRERLGRLAGARRIWDGA